MLALLSIGAVLGLPLLDSGSLDSTPAPEDVKAGWLAFGVFLGLIVAVVLLGFSFAKQLRKTRAARDAGVFGDPPVTSEDQAPPAP